MQVTWQPPPGPHAPSRRAATAQAPTTVSMTQTPTYFSQHLHILHHLPKRIRNLSMSRRRRHILWLNLPRHYHQRMRTCQLTSSSHLLLILLTRFPRRRISPHFQVVQQIRDFTSLDSSLVHDLCFPMHSLGVESPEASIQRLVKWLRCLRSVTSRTKLTLNIVFIVEAIHSQVGL